MVPVIQWLVRWGCLGVVALGTLMQIVGMASPYWIKDQARPLAYPAFLRLLKQEGIDITMSASSDARGNYNSSSSSGGVVPGSAASTTMTPQVTRAEADVGLWRWCVVVEVVGGVFYRACHTPASSDFPGWWRACQALSVVGTFMGILACVCAGLELHYFFRREVRFSGLIVLCAISCFVAAVAMGLSHGMFASKYMERLLSIIHLPILGGPGTVSSMFSPVLGWAFGLGAAGAALIGVTGIILVAFITRTYPTYQRTETDVVV